MLRQIIILMGLAPLIAPIAFSAPATAQQRELTPGMHYTRIYNDPLPNAPTAPAVPSVQKPAPPQRPQSASTSPAQAEEIVEESAQSRVWNKYKALAAGTAGPPAEESAAAQTAESAPSPSPRMVQKTSVQVEGPKSAVAELIGRWHEQKEQQKDMRSKSFAVPENLKTKTP
ncbi:MAG: hypothetical protein IT559_06985 [Alphaproteobacteria bacterium]|nr:hypothetical protein [Alphaproteobacteria bacterium]